MEVMKLSKEPGMARKKSNIAVEVSGHGDERAPIAMANSKLLQSAWAHEQG